MVYTPKNLKAMGYLHVRGPIMASLRAQIPTFSHSLIVGIPHTNGSTSYLLPYPHVPHIQRKRSRGTKMPNLQGVETIAMLHHN